ncbi:hypothetical protein MNV_330019 [Candidatus Methanoperedens nitroreducens]|uniref:Uncharacterized protein n=1 Tax=Candidatus Methanoperedens nitratireducens TaxID=1392998 RepID=A0A284VPZ4_9EURY|nr:hypothetical protein MNV_330019 [Candidatus Methanoperedens nitroreducens]
MYCLPPKTTRRFKNVRTTLNNSNIRENNINTAKTALLCMTYITRLEVYKSKRYAEDGI